MCADTCRCSMHCQQGARHGNKRFCNDTCPPCAPAKGKHSLAARSGEHQNRCRFGLRSRHVCQVLWETGSFNFAPNHYSFKLLAPRCPRAVAPTHSSAPSFRALQRFNHLRHRNEKKSAELFGGCRLTNTSRRRFVTTVCPAAESFRS